MTGTHEKHDAFKELIKHLDTQLQYRQQLVNQLEQENTQVLRCLEQIKAKNEELMKVRQLKKDMATNQENIKMNDNEPHGKRLNTRPIPPTNDYYRPQIPPVIGNIPDHVTKEKLKLAEY